MSPLLKRGEERIQIFDSLAPPKILGGSGGETEFDESRRFSTGRRNADEPAYRFKISLFAICGHEIRNQLASYGECCAIGIPLLPCIFIYQGQIRIPPWHQLRRFHGHPLDLFIPLLRNRCTRSFVGRSFFTSAKSTVTDGLSDRSET